MSSIGARSANVSMATILLSWSMSSVITTITTNSVTRDRGRFAAAADSVSGERSVSSGSAGTSLSREVGASSGLSGFSSYVLARRGPLSHPDYDGRAPYGAWGGSSAG